MCQHSIADPFSHVQLHFLVRKNIVVGQVYIFDSPSQYNGVLNAHTLSHFCGLSANRLAIGFFDRLFPSAHFLIGFPFRVFVYVQILFFHILCSSK